MHALALLLLALPAQDAGKLAVIVGKVEAKTGDGEWKALALGAAVPANTWIRTAAKSRALIEVTGGSELRINTDTEMLLEAPRKMTLKVGGIYVRMAKDPSPFEIQADRTRILTEGPVLDVAHSASTRTTTLIMLEGKATVSTRKDRQFLMAGYACTTFDGTLNTPDPAGDPSAATAWVHELLVARGKDGAAELEKRFKEMLPSLGGSLDLYDAAFRTTGEACVPLLLAHIRQAFDENQQATRRGAMKLLADLAPAPAAPDFVPLLKEPDPETRTHAARGLKRLTGQDLGFNEKYWGDEEGKVEKGVAAWTEWIKRNGAGLKK